MQPDEEGTADALDDLIDHEFDFYGVDNTCFKLDDTIYEVIEDEDDSYRSMLGAVVVRDGKAKIFFGMPIARVVIQCEENGNYSTYTLKDLHDDHCWLRFGTDDYEDYDDGYYPLFVFDYTPKGP